MTRAPECWSCAAGPGEAPFFVCLPPEHETWCVLCAIERASLDAITADLARNRATRSPPESLPRSRVGLAAGGARPVLADTAQAAGIGRG